MNLDIAFDLRPSPTLGAFYDCDDLYRLIVGPVGSGKSSVSVVELMRRARETPPMRPEPDGHGGMKQVRRSRALVVRNTYPELRDTTIKTFEAWVPTVLREWRAQDKCYVVRFHDGQHEVELEVLFRALDQPDDVKKLLSLELTFAYINEAKEVPRGVFDVLSSRIKRFPAVKDLDDGVLPWFGIWMDTNPPDTDHWLFKLFEEERPAKHSLFHQPDALSPEGENRKFVTPGYYEDLVLGKSKDWVDVMVRSKYGFVKDGKPIYPEWNDAIHAAEFPLLTNAITLGMDFGLTPACVYLQRDPRDGQLQVFDESVTEDMGAVRFSAEVRRKLNAEYPGRSVEGHGDPAGEQRVQTDERTPFDIVQAAGLPISPAPTNDWTLRREAVAGLLSRLTMTGRPALVVHPRCKVLRKAMGGGYCYRRLQVSGDDRFADVPNKNRFSHVAEALQYAAVGLGEDHRAVAGSDEPRHVALRFKVRRAYNGG